MDKYLRLNNPPPPSILEENKDDASKGYLGAIKWGNPCKRHWEQCLAHSQHSSYDLFFKINTELGRVDNPKQQIFREQSQVIHRGRYIPDLHPNPPSAQLSVYWFKEYMYYTVIKQL